SRPDHHDPDAGHAAPAGRRHGPGAGGDVAGQAGAVRARASLAGQFASVGEDPTGAENLVMIARQPGHPRWRAKTRAGELLAAFGLAEAAGRSGRTPAVCAGGWPGRDPELVFL